MAALNVNESRNVGKNAQMLQQIKSNAFRNNDKIT